MGFVPFRSKSKRRKKEPAVGEGHYVTQWMYKNTKIVYEPNLDGGYKNEIGLWKGRVQKWKLRGDTATQEGRVRKMMVLAKDKRQVRAVWLKTGSSKSIKGEVPLGSRDGENAKVLFFKSERQMEAFMGVYSTGIKFKGLSLEDWEAAFIIKRDHNEKEIAWLIVCKPKSDNEHFTTPAAECRAFKAALSETSTRVRDLKIPEGEVAMCDIGSAFELF